MSDVDQLEELLARKRTPSEWRSVQGFRKESVPWKLWEKAKKGFWDPADIDFTKDKQQWDSLDEAQQLQVAGLARGFMVGEEGVTLDIVPLILAVADEGRTEEAMYLTTFAMEEAKHIDFFRKWFDGVGADPAELAERQRRRMEDQGSQPQQGSPMFESELPRIMRRVLTDRSPQAFLDCGVTYNQFIEGVLAISGYKVWGAMFASFGLLPGLQEGIGLVRRDEGRHITYGTYLCRRILANNPELLDWARNRMYELRDGTYPGGGGGGAYGANGNGNGNGNGEQRQGEGGPIMDFQRFAMEQVERRVQILEKAATLDPEQAELGVGAEEVEEQMDSLV